jgi:two-component system, NarL family, response regulator NreC
MTVVRRPTRVALVDDHHIVRQGLRLLIASEADLEVVGEADGRDEAFELVERERPDVLLLDISLGDQDALPMIAAFHARFPSMRVLVLTMHSDAETVRQSLIAGAAGYVIKGAVASELTQGIRAVARGERYLHSSITAYVVDDSLQWLQSGSGLTTREREILSLFAAGHSPSAIGRSLGISVNTVRRHLANVTTKHGLHGRAALTRYAAERGMIRPAG